MVNLVVGDHVFVEQIRAGHAAGDGIWRLGIVRRTRSRIIVPARSGPARIYGRGCCRRTKPAQARTRPMPSSPTCPPQKSQMSEQQSSCPTHGYPAGARLARGAANGRYGNVTFMSSPVLMTGRRTRSRSGSARSAPRCARRAGCRRWSRGNGRARARAGRCSSISDRSRAVSVEGHACGIRPGRGDALEAAQIVVRDGARRFQVLDVELDDLVAGALADVLDHGGDARDGSVGSVGVWIARMSLALRRQRHRDVAVGEASCTKGRSRRGRAARFSR